MGEGGKLREAGWCEGEKVDGRNSPVARMGEGWLLLVDFAVVGRCRGDELLDALKEGVGVVLCRGGGALGARFRLVELRWLCSELAWASKRASALNEYW